MASAGNSIACSVGAVLGHPDPACGGKQAAQTPSPAQLAPGLAAAAGATVKPPAPRVGGAPPFGGQQLVGFATWLWTSNATPLSAQASVPGLAATVRATPTTTTWTFTPENAPPQAQAESITCRADAPAYDTGRPDSQQQSDCTHTFTWHGRYRVSAATRWAVSWTATTGQSGTLPDLQATTALDLNVQEAQATTD